MPDSFSTGRNVLADLMSEYTHSEVPAQTMQLVAEGASGRCVMRCILPSCSGIIGIYWTSARADNESFLPAALGLRSAGVLVPEVYISRTYEGGCGACLVEDLGKQSLFSLRDAPRTQRMSAYRAALHTMQSFHSISPTWPLQPPFDADLYTWEQEYFAQHLLGNHLHLSVAAGFHKLPECRQLAEFLASLSRVTIHRDFQSQNIILRAGKAYCIDFQGMRLGLPEYDVASLLYDPYVNLAEEEREELLDALAGLSGSSACPLVLQACALQRLMQALGAYANIGHNSHQDWYLTLIPTTLCMLRRLCTSISPDSPAHPLAACIASVIS